MLKKRIAHLFILTLLMLGCEDPFEVPSSVSNEGILVVEGRISDQRTSVELSRTSNLDSLVIELERSARVTIEDELGNTVAILSEVQAGKYVVDQPLTVGEMYRVRIQTDGNEIYLSDFSQMLDTPPISEINLKLDTVSTRLEILLDTEDPQNRTRYYLWEYEETFQYSPAFNSLFKYENEELLEREPDEQVDNCWKTEESTNILLGTSIALDQDVISDQLIASHVLSRNQKFSIAYSINVNQFALSVEEFEFWTLLETNSETLGTLFDPQPSQLPSNLSCISDPSKRVVGFVGASSVAEERIFLTRSTLPREIPFFRYPDCEADTINYREELRALREPIPLEDLIEVLYRRQFTSGSFVPLNYAVNEATLDTIGFRYSNKFCADCREQGGTNVKPNFWF